MQDLHSNINAVRALSPAAITTNTTTVGETIDKKDYDSIEFVFASGTRTDGSYACKIFAGDASNMSDEAEVTAAAELLGTAPTIAASNAVQRMGYRGAKRYVRCKVVSSSVTTGVAGFSAVAVQGHPRVAPVA